MVTFRALTEADFDQLAEWLGSDHVRAWWRDPEAPSKVPERYGPCVRGEVPTEVFVVVSDGDDVGIIQRYRIEDHPAWFESVAGTGLDPAQAAGIDYLIGDEQAIGRGLGTEMIRDFSDMLFAELGDVALIVVAPHVENAASRRVLEKADYERCWSGLLESDDPADAFEAAIFVMTRPSLPERSDRRLGPTTDD